MPRRRQTSPSVSDLIDGTIGRYSQFHRTFGYYGDGASASASAGAAVMPLDWRSRAVEYVTPDGLATAVCPSADDIAIAQLHAWREKDQMWLREALRSGIAKADRVAALLRNELSARTTSLDELARRLSVAARSAPAA